ncbi:hypothetical protein WME76_23595 [Sorangium sp. So ce119]|uniref:hypothetical protein n=1 Tax=Sorangium sp. So ce119 TaxID=3133279 RepID=UPI003F61B968
MLCHRRLSSTCPEAGRRASASSAPLTGGAPRRAAASSAPPAGGAPRRALALLSTLAALTALAPAARAAEPTREERAAAVALFDEGRALMAAGKYAEACPKFAESHGIDPGIGTLFNLSDCHERIGRTATAWIGFRDVAAASLSAGQMERERVARARAAALEPRLSRLQIVVPPESAVAGLELTRDGVPVGRALWGTAVPLDPGEHRVAAAAPGHSPWETTIAVEKPGVVSVTVPALARAPASSAAPGTDVAPKAIAAPPPADPPKADAPSPQGGSIRKPIGIVGVGLGVVGLGVGTALGFMAKSTFDKATEGGHCNEAGECVDQTGLDLRDDAVMKGNIGTAAFIAGAVLAAGGAILWITAPSAPPAGTASARGLTGGAPWSARVGVGPGSVWIEGKL